MLSAKNRLKKNYQFGYIYKKGRAVPAKSLILTFVPVRGGGIKIGFSVGNKTGKAVVRNLMRRRLRECARKLLPRIRPGHHCVVSARPGIVNEGFDGIYRDMEYAFLKAGILN